MKYLIAPSCIIDITKEPYNADNTGKKDCTKAIIQAIDDCVRGYIDGLNELRQKLLEEYKKYGTNVYTGAECGRVINGEVYMTAPETIPPSQIIYFPSGTYLVSDTISYSFKNLVAPQHPNYTCELCRNIHILGESRENTVIRLADNSKGFELGNRKPVISFNTASVEDKETTNCAQMNTLEDITIDCGRGNDGAVGVLYASSNCGRIENIEIKSESSFCGIEFDYGSECCVSNIKIHGFDYGMKSCLTSPVIITDADLADNRLAGILTKNGNICCRNTETGNIPLFRFAESDFGRYFTDTKNIETLDRKAGDFIFTESENPLIKLKTFPKNIRSTNPDEWVCVDDYGAVGDGVTDSTAAIQKAMNSGKSVILFGKGSYVISKTINVPATVCTIDFMYCAIVPGLSLIIGEMDAIFDFCEESEKILFAENLMSCGCGFFRCFKHSAKRTVVISDMSMAASLYFNTVGGSEVYFDNCFTHTEHYAQDACLHRDGYTPVFCRMIPVELHNQKVYAKNLNIERGDLELLNAASELLIDGYKVEGPGVLVKTVNGGKTAINLFNAAWWGNKIETNALFEISESAMNVIGGHIFCYPQEDKYCGAIRKISGNHIKQLSLKECSTKITGTDALGRDLGCLIENLEIKK